MTLREFIEKHGVAAARDVAAEAGTNYAYFSQIAYGHRRASPHMAQRIEKATGGEVTLCELRPDIWGDAA